MSDPDPGQASLQVEPPPAEPESGAPPVFQVIVRSLFAGLCTEVATLGLLLLLLRMADPTQSSGPLLFVGVYSGLVAGALFALAELRGIPGRFFGVGLALLLTPLVLVAVEFGHKFHGSSNPYQAVQDVFREGPSVWPTVLLFVLAAAALHAPLLLVRRRGLGAGVQARAMLLGAMVLTGYAFLGPTLIPALRIPAWSLQALTVGEYAALVLPRCGVLPLALLVGDRLAALALRGLTGQVVEAPPPQGWRGHALLGATLLLGFLVPWLFQRALPAEDPPSGAVTRIAFEVHRLHWIAGGDELYERGCYLEFDGPAWSWDNLLGIRDGLTDVGVPRVVGFTAGYACDWRFMTLIQRDGLVDPVSSFSGGEAYMPWFRLAAARGSAPALARIARAQEDEGEPREALETYRRAAERGSLAARWRLGEATCDGLLGLEPDVEAGRALFEGAAKIDPYYAYRWARVLERRAATVGQAEAWLERAASRGNPHAMLALGQRCQGEGREDAALEWYDRLMDATSTAPAPGAPGASNWWHVQSEGHNNLRALLEKRGE